VPVIEKLNLAEFFAQFDQLWTPKVVAELNDTEVRLVKIDGEFVWHHHDDEDDLFLFLVVSGSGCSSATATWYSSPVS
jgi:hypothetical protein